MKNFDIGDKVYFKNTKVGRGHTFGYFQHMNYIGGNIIYYLKLDDNNIIAVNESDVNRDPIIYDLDKRISKFEKMLEAVEESSLPYESEIALMDNVEKEPYNNENNNSSKLPAMNFISSDYTKAINSYGKVFSIGDIVCLDDNHDDCAKIQSFSIDKENYEVKVTTTKGCAHIDFIVNKETISDRNTMVNTKEYCENEDIHSQDVPTMHFTLSDNAEVINLLSEWREYINSITNKETISDSNDTVNTDDVSTKEIHFNDDEHLYMPHMDMKYVTKDDVVYESAISKDDDMKYFIIVNYVCYEGYLYMQIDKNNNTTYLLKDEDDVELIRSKQFNYFSTSYYSAKIKFGEKGLSSYNEDIEILKNDKLNDENNKEHTDREFNVGDIVWVDYDGVKTIGKIFKSFDDYKKYIVELKDVMSIYTVYSPMSKTDLNHWSESNFMTRYDYDGEFPYYDLNIDSYFKLIDYRQGFKLENRIYKKKGN